MNIEIAKRYIYYSNNWFTYRWLLWIILIPIFIIALYIIVSRRRRTVITPNNQYYDQQQNTYVPPPGTQNYGYVPPIDPMQYVPPQYPQENGYKLGFNHSNNFANDNSAYTNGTFHTYQDMGNGSSSRNQPISDDFHRNYQLETTPIEDYAAPTSPPPQEYSRPLEPPRGHTKG